MKGICRGDTSSPVLFTAAVQEIFTRMNIEASININGVKLSIFRFADDIVLFAESEEQLQLKDMIEELNKEGKKDGMKLHKKKTKIMCNEVTRRGLMRDAEQLEEVAEYMYLGRLITSGNEMNKEIDQRITSGWRRFGEYIATCLRTVRSLFA